VDVAVGGKGADEIAGFYVPSPLNFAASAANPRCRATRKAPLVIERRAAASLIDAPSTAMARDIALSGWQAFEMAIDVSYEHGWFALAAGQDFGEAVERKVDPAAAPAQRIDHFMARDRPKPRAKRRLVPALPLEMNGKQRLLHNVLGATLARPRRATARSTGINCSRRRR
jgi:hypothetical protein